MTSSSEPGTQQALSAQLDQHTHTHTHLYTVLYIYNIYIHISIHMYVYTYIHMYTNVHIYIDRFDAIQVKVGSANLTASLAARLMLVSFVASFPSLAF